MRPRITDETAPKRLGNRGNAAGDCCACYLLTIPAKQLECSTVCIERRGFQSVTAHIALRCAARQKGYCFLGPTSANVAPWGSRPRTIQRSPRSWWDPMSTRPFFSLTPVESAWPLYFGIFGWNQDSTVDITLTAAVAGAAGGEDPPLLHAAINIPANSSPDIAKIAQCGALCSMSTRFSVTYLLPRGLSPGTPANENRNTAISLQVVLIALDLGDHVKSGHT